MSLKKAAIFAGLGLLVMTLSWLSADYLVFQKLTALDNVTQVANNIRANTIQFRMGIFGLLIVVFCDLAVAWALYFFFKPVNQSISLFAAWLRLVYTLFLGIALLNYLDILQLTNEADYLKVFQIDVLNAEIMLSIHSFYSDWHFGLIFFGFHLALLGYLAFKASYVPKVIGLLLMVTGASYLIDYTGKLLSPDFEVTYSLILGWGELIFMFWLLIKGSAVREQTRLNRCLYL
ncbi:DUF4386 domain-containing protein [Ascidiimonas aurantiaca]|uniref:DUF4386 domain-containing protein n=1 Tax=Ascidiimonas aurantiaca TaxID=1685432 RepID=UPI0030EDF705